MGNLTCVSFFADRARKPSWGGQGNLTLIWKNCKFFSPYSKEEGERDRTLFLGPGVCP